MKEESKTIIPIEKNSLKKDIFSSFRSNSHNHYKNISNYNYEHRIKLNPLGEGKSMDIRQQVPLSHIHDYFIKSNYKKNKDYKNAYERADIQSKINYHLKKQKHQNLLNKEKFINKTCQNKNKELKKSFELKKHKLKDKLTVIIKDALRFSTKNSAVRAMLPDNINEIVEKAKKETQDLSVTLNMSHISKISRVSSVGVRSGMQKNEFLNLLGVDIENLNADNINIDIDKCWNYILRLAKGRKVEEILRYKVVNEIMSITEKKSTEKAKKIYEKLDIYKKYMEGKQSEENHRKKKEEEKKQKELMMNTKEYIKSKMQKSLSQKKIFNQEMSQKEKTIEAKRNKRIRSAKIVKKEKKRIESERNPFKRKNVIRLDAYRDVNRIIDFIDNSKNNSQSLLCKSHFTNIQLAKNIYSTLQMNNNDISFK